QRSRGECRGRSERLSAHRRAPFERIGWVTIQLRAVTPRPGRSISRASRCPNRNWAGQPRKTGYVGGMRFFLVDAFTDQAFKGNSAGVVLLDEPADAGWMQDVAAEMKHAETAFVVTS